MYLIRILRSRAKLGVLHRNNIKYQNLGLQGKLVQRILTEQIHMQRESPVWSQGSAKVNTRQMVFHISIRDIPDLRIICLFLVPEEVIFSIFDEMIQDLTR